MSVRSCSHAACSVVIVLALVAIALWPRAGERLGSVESGSASTVDRELEPVKLAGESTYRVEPQEDARRTVDVVPAEPVPATPGTESTSLVVRPIWVGGDAPEEGAVLRLVPDGWGERSSVELGADGHWTVDRSQLGAIGAELALRCRCHWIDEGQWLLASAPGVRDLRIYATGSVEVTVSGYAEGVPRAVAVPAEPDGRNWGDVMFEGGVWESLETGVGRVRLDGLRAGRHPILLLDASGDSTTTAALERQVVVVQSGATTEERMGANGPLTSAVLTGRVLRGGEPVPGQEVRCEGFAGSRYARGVRVSDEQGVFALELPEVGWFEVQVGAPDFTVPSLVTAIHVTHATYQDLELPGGSIVAAPDGFGVPLNIFVARHETDVEALGLRQWASRDAVDGELVVFDGLEAGRYEVRVRPRQSAHRQLTARMVDVTANGPTTRVDLAPTPTRTLDVRVVDATGSPAGWVNVYWRRTGTVQPDWRRLGDTDEAGLASGDVPRGVPLLLQAERRAGGSPLQCALASLTIEIPAASDSPTGTSEPLEIHCESAGVLVVTLESAGAPTAFAALLYEPNGSRPVIGRRQGLDVAQRMDPLAPGPYDLVARDITGRIHRRRVVVEAGTTTRVTLP